ncbi:hypothetical protein B0J14DRAFT_691292 [Halenospora varia]|nr:hypothetical protein B0J14DRAFT_691292 [Halenospora varia]
MDEEAAMMTPCGDSYHLECLTTWVKEQATCPMCRVTIGIRRGTVVLQLTTILRACGANPKTTENRAEAVAHANITIPLSIQSPVLSMDLSLFDLATSVSYGFTGLPPRGATGPMNGAVQSTAYQIVEGANIVISTSQSAR